MKKILLIIVIFISSLSVIGQKIFEQLALQSIIKNRGKYNLATDSIFINKNVKVSPQASYFLSKQGWHVKGILKENCYYNEDSIENKRLAESNFILQSSYKDVFLVEENKELSNKKQYIYIFKRFHYCKKIYIVVLIRDKQTLVNTDVLFTMNKKGKIIATDSQSYIK